MGLPGLVEEHQPIRSHRKSSCSHLKNQDSKDTLILLIISHTPHYKDQSGRVYGWEPTVRENDYISDLFESVTVLGFLHPRPVPGTARAYTKANIAFHGLKPSGGNRIIDKLKAIPFLLYYLIVIHLECRKLSASDWIYVRCPCNVGLLACLYLMIFKIQKRWFKYAGNWMPQGNEPLSYRMQRFILRRNLCRGKVTVNGQWYGQPEHILSFLNPCFAKSEIESTTINPDEKELRPPFHFLFVGRIEHEKGVGRIMDIAGMLKRENIDFRINLVGEGKDMTVLKEYCRYQQLQDIITFCGSKSREDLKPYYRKSHLFLFPSSASEGWPKVLSEAMNYSCVPIAGDISSIPQIIKKYDCGIILPTKVIDLWIKEIRNILSNTDKWKQLAVNGKKAAIHFTYENMVYNLKHNVLCNDLDH
jgi:glycosyltransferase involved in cell wall biosynthesis